MTSITGDHQVMAIEKQESESQEKSDRSVREYISADAAALPVSMQALLDRVQAQQRRIAALEVAEKVYDMILE